MANYIYKDGELMHYGVPGMRWGFRKARYSETSGRRGWFGRKRKLAPDDEPAKKKTRIDEEKESDKPIEKRKVSDLSDDEIRARLARMDLEKRYTEATEKPKKDPNAKLRAEVERMQLEARRKELVTSMRPQKSHRGRDFTLRVLEQIGEKTLVNIGTQAGVKGLGLAINKMFNVDPYDTEKRIVNPNKGQADKK